MQMFQWEAPPQLIITAPEAIAGSYINAQASFGPDFPADPNPAPIVALESSIPSLIPAQASLVGGSLTIQTTSKATSSSSSAGAASSE